MWRISALALHAQPTYQYRNLPSANISMDQTMEHSFVSYNLIADHTLFVNSVCLVCGFPTYLTQNLSYPISRMTLHPLYASQVSHAREYRCLLASYTASSHHDLYAYIVVHGRSCLADSTKRFYHTSSSFNASCSYMYVHTFSQLLDIPIQAYANECTGLCF